MGNFLSDAYNSKAGWLLPGGALYKGYQYFYGDPAKQQKGAYNQAATDTENVGKNAVDYYNNQSNKALGFFTGQSATTPYRSSAPAYSPTSPVAGPGTYLGHVAASAPKGAPAAAPGLGTAPDQILGRMAADRPTQQQDYYNQLLSDGGPQQAQGFYDKLTATGQPQQQQAYFDYMTGQVGGQTNQEQLYAERKGGTDPAAQYEDQRAIRELNTQLAARGGFNSSRGMSRIEDYLANVGAQRSHDLASLAAGADSSRLGLSTAYGGAAAGASGEQRGYFSDLGNAAQAASAERSGYLGALGGAAKGASGEQSDYYSNLIGASTDIAKAKAGISTGEGNLGGGALTQTQLAAIEARLAAAGVDAATRKQMMSDIMSGVKTGAAIAAA